MERGCAASSATERNSNMIRAIVAVAALASAAAFTAPLKSGVAARSRSVAVRAEFADGMIGADGPEPNSKNFDPLNLAENNPEWLPYFREAEIKHGRICMLATVGLVAPDFFRLPGDVFQGVSIVDAHDQMVSKGPMVILLILIGVWEVVSIPTLQELKEGNRAAGDFAFDPLKLGRNEEKIKRYALAELKNGRLAMLAFSGMITQAVLSGNSFPFLFS